MPLGHLGLNVGDLAAAKAYYDELMPLLAFEPFIAADDRFSYRPTAGKVGTWLFFYRSREDRQRSCAPRRDVSGRASAATSL